jgi:hypothetical protein
MKYVVEFLEDKHRAYAERMGIQTISDRQSDLQEVVSNFLELGINCWVTTLGDLKIAYNDQYLDTLNFGEL